MQHLSYSAPSLPMFTLEFRSEVNLEETIESWGYPPVPTKDRMIVSWG